MVIFALRVAVYDLGQGDTQCDGLFESFPFCCCFLFLSFVISVILRFFERNLWCACYGCKQQDGALVPQLMGRSFVRLECFVCVTPNALDTIPRHFIDQRSISWVRQHHSFTSTQSIYTFYYSKYYDYGLLKLWLIITMLYSRVCVAIPLAIYTEHQHGTCNNNSNK